MLKNVSKIHFILDVKSKNIKYHIITLKMYF